MTTDPEVERIAGGLSPYRAVLLLSVADIKTTPTLLRHLAPPSVRLPWEWASPHMLWLRHHDLVEHSGRRIGGRLAHRLTPLGRRVAAVLREGDAAREARRRSAHDSDSRRGGRQMADQTKIEWTDATWNPITGCTLVSEGCRHCYAATLAAGRLQHHWSRRGLARRNAAGEAKFTGEVRFNAPWLDQPLRWKRPRMIFACAHADLFHESVPDDWIDQVFAVMALAPQHAFQVLTKRPERARVYLSADGEATLRRIANAPPPGLAICKAEIVQRIHPDYSGPWGQPKTRWPLPNVWLGASVEDQATADARVPELLATPAAIRLVSYEPALGPVDFSNIKPADRYEINALDGFDFDQGGVRNRLDWIIVGGESGRGARPMDEAWARSLRDQCARAGVPFFMKQMAKKAPIPADLMVRETPCARGSDRG